MSKLLQIRKKLGMTQEELAEQLGCIQQNISYYETTGASLSVNLARRLIDVSASRGLDLSFDDIYSEGAIA